MNKTIDVKTFRLNLINIIGDKRPDLLEHIKASMEFEKLFKILIVENEKLTKSLEKSNEKIIEFSEKIEDIIDKENKILLEELNDLKIKYEQLLKNVSFASKLIGGQL